MPIDYTRYPPDWHTFSRAIRAQAGQQCQCTGECGLHRTHPGPRRCVEQNGQPAQFARGKIVLTVAHLCACEPPCAEPTHVKAMCQTCHLRVDVPLHRRNAARTRLAAKEAQGQGRLFT